MKQFDFSYINKEWNIQSTYTLSSDQIIHSINTANAKKINIFNFTLKLAVRRQKQGSMREKSRV